MTKMYYKPDGYHERQVNRWYYSLLIFIIPLIVFSASVNMVTRVSDAYDWRLEKNADILDEDEKADVVSLSKADVFLEEDVFAEQIALYINGGTDLIATYDSESELKEYYEKRAAKVTDNDYSRLNALSTFDNILIVIGGISLIILVLLFILMVRGGYESKAVLREKTKKSIPVFLSLILLMFLYTAVKPVYHFINCSILGLSYAKKDLLYTLMGDGFPLTVSLFIAGIALIVFALLFYVIWICTKPRDIFNERRYFR